ncbi:hypothetical protein OHB26_25245 [Nocardia sp. NBC_01503]|uniref:hypothetical protein n=1 Tax=Nocardia sp. NBC_01503 TaxID=2975997 RepID=UPI002E7BB45E|nr:hypothetical protein [Nocardia sp. NBC_01503]WTL30240.1 hypothetical protein OHB26_25245 [Nocardia sp. NBC_01503]
MARAVKAAAARVCGGIFGIVACLAGIAPAHAEAPPGPAVVDGTMYFALGGWNCSIDPNGTVGCDLAVPAALMNVLYAGLQVPVPNVPAIIIDSAALPARPDWVSGGSHTLPGGNPALPRLIATTNHDPQYSVTHAGATCQITFNGAATCSSLGHGFSQWGPEPFGY